MTTRLVYALLLGVVYLGVTGAPLLENGLIGVLFGALVSMRRRPGGEGFVVTIRRLLRAPLLCFGIVRELLSGSWRTTRVFLSKTGPRLGYVHILIGERSEQGAAFSGLVITASPGSTVVDLDPVSGSMLLQVIDASDPQRVREDQHRFYQRYQEAVIP